jgi:signal transduction histidine kinase
MKKTDHKIKENVEETTFDMVANEPYEIIYADPRDEEIHLKFLKRAQLSTHMARWFLDHEYNQLLWSDGIFETLEIDSKKYGASSSNYLEVVHPEDQKIKIQADKDLKTNRNPMEINYRLLFKDGRIKWINEICSTDFDPEGIPIRSYGTIQDITKYKLAEETFRLKEEQFKSLFLSSQKKYDEKLLKKEEKLRKLTNNEIRLKEQIETKDRFLSIIAHDLRSPFNSIIGLLELMLHQYDEFSDSERKTYLRLLDNDASRTLKLLDDLLEWAKLQTGKISFKPEKQKLLPVIEYVLNTLGSAIHVKHLTINHNISNEFELFADYHMLITILQNLIDNAIKYSYPQGIITINAHPKDNRIEFVVSDHGIGMNDEIKNKLFKIDKKNSIPGTSNERGGGLGLFLCKDFIEKHKGKIWVESELGMGSKFHFRIPMYMS